MSVLQVAYKERLDTSPQLLVLKLPGQSSVFSPDGPLGGV